jgi:hypothetical protein
MHGEDTFAEHTGHQIRHRRTTSPWRRDREHAGRLVDDHQSGFSAQDSR